MKILSKKAIAAMYNVPYRVDTKKINNTWSDVATTLGVDKDTFQNDMKETVHGFRHIGYQEHN